MRSTGSKSAISKSIAAQNDRAHWLLMAHDPAKFVPQVKQVAALLLADDIPAYQTNEIALKILD